MNQEALDNLQSVSLTCVTPERDVKWYQQSRILLISDGKGRFLNSLSTHIQNICGVKAKSYGSTLRLLGALEY